MPRLLYFVNPVRTTVGRLYAQKWNDNFTVGPHTLPTSGTAVYFHNWTFPRMLRPGYVVHIGFSFNPVGSWFGKFWRGLIEVKDADLVCDDASRPDCVWLNKGFALGPGLLLSDGFSTRKVGEGEDGIRLRFTYIWENHGGSPPHDVNVQVAAVAYKPTAFVNWVE